MKSIYKERFIWTDLLIVLVLDIILWITLSSCKVDINNCITEATAISLFSSLIGTWGALLGFIITALSILLGIKENEFIKALKETDHYKNICYLYLDTSIWLGAATIFSIVGLLLVKSLLPTTIIGSFLFPACITRIGRCLQMLSRIITFSNK